MTVFFHSAGFYSPRDPQNDRSSHSFWKATDAHHVLQICHPFAFAHHMHHLLHLITLFNTHIDLVQIVPTPTSAASFPTHIENLRILSLFRCHGKYNRLHLVES